MKSAFGLSTINTAHKQDSSAMSTRTERFQRKPAEKSNGATSQTPEEEEKEVTKFTPEEEAVCVMVSSPSGTTSC
jgi:hypothetical protein